MDEQQQELAEAAQQKAGGPIDWDALVVHGCKAYQMLARSLDALYVEGGQEAISECGQVTRDCGHG